MKKMDLLIDESNLVPSGTTPVATNATPSLSSYCNKKIYEAKSFILSPIVSRNKPINILYDKPFYGKVDLDNNPIVVNPTKTSTKMFANRKITFLNFVMEAQTEFFYYWDFLKSKKLVTDKSSLYDINLVSSLVNFEQNYENYLDTIYSKFRDYLIKTNADIKSFEHFIELFVGFIDFSSPDVQFTFSNFILSRMADPHISGMCFQVKLLDASDDDIKYRDILSDPNYAIFKKTAMKFGFFVDKHIPWRLYADIDSPAMKPYMDKYNVTQDNLYTTNFLPASNYDLYFLRKYFLKFFNVATLNNKKIQIPKFNICETTGNAKVQYTEIFVPHINEQFVSKDKNFDRTIMKLYVYLKGRENNYNWDQSRFDNYVKTFIEIKETLDTARAMKYIWPLVKLPAESSEIRRNFHYRRG